jgi:hypothetical protein
MHSSSLLEGVHKKQSLIQDRIRGVVHGSINGVYLFGRPGTAKTFLVRTTLDKLHARFVYVNGHLTAAKLFDLIEQNPTAVIVLDDVSSIFDDRKALQILLAALGTSPDGTRVRPVCYRTRKEDKVVRFSGSIVAISNLQLAGHKSPVLAALRDRAQVLSFALTDEEMEALIYSIAGTSPRGVESIDATRVATFLLGVCRDLQVSPTIRLFVDKALSDFQGWKNDITTSHWNDLVRSSVQELVIAPLQPLRDISRKEQMESERRLVQEICAMFSEREQRVEAWTARTGKSQSAFYRRFREMGGNGSLSA